MNFLDQKTEKMFKHLNVKRNVDFRIVNRSDGKGCVFEEWHIDAPMPDMKDVDAVNVNAETYHLMRVYPDMGEFVDAYVKQHSSDPELVQKGKEQMADYCKKCEAVKEKYPKE